ncbi:MAG: HXXEE domain-containing protein [Devosia sp.]
MTLETAAWLAMAAYSLHIMEEFMFNWRDWARNVIKLPVDWSDFYITNSVVVAVGIAQAMLAPTLPIVALSFTGLMVINGIFFHIVPVIRTKGRYSPGVATAILLFAPSIWASWSAALAAGIDVWTIVLGVVFGAVLMAYPIVMLKLKSHPYFDQSKPLA